MSFYVQRELENANELVGEESFYQPALYRIRAEIEERRGNDRDAERWREKAATEADQMGAQLFLKSHSVKSTRE